MAAYESVILVKPEVYVYNVPPRSSNRAVRAADWNLAAPDWSGRLRITGTESGCTIKLEDKVTGEPFADCPVDSYPSVAVEAVSDSSRYFVIKVQDPSGRHAFLGLGFQDRADSFDFNVALQDHFKWLKRKKEIEHEGPQKVKDYRLKPGESLSINIGSVPAPKAKAANTSVGLPTVGLLPPPSTNARVQSSSTSFRSGASSLQVNSSPMQPSCEPPTRILKDDDEDWGSFLSSRSQEQSPGSSFGSGDKQPKENSGNWVQF